MSILDTVFRRREPAVKYRTVDGGHPAPYPDMTDAQLYNYEVTFNVPKKTFDKPPNELVASADAIGAGRTEPHVSEYGAEEQPSVTELRTTAIHTARTRTRPSGRTNQPSGMTRPEPEGSEPRSARAERSFVPDPDLPVPPLDLAKPVRTITTKQPVEIITTRARHPLFKVLGYIGDDQVVTMFTLDGQISENGPRFLENVPQKQVLYLNIYLNRSIGGRERFFLTQHETKDGADAAATGERIACVPVEFDLY